MPPIHQFVAGLSRTDAITNEAFVMRDIFRSWGYRSEIFCESRRVPLELRREAGDAAAYAAECRPDDAVLLHLSIGSPVNEVFQALRCRRALLYHNITPPAYFRLVNEETATNLARGRTQLRALAGAAEINLADSCFNAQELRMMGYRDPEVLPLIIDFDRLSARRDRAVLRRFSDSKKTVLFVGRCAPNKKLEDALTAFFHFQRFVEPQSRFVHVGSFAGTERYYHLLLTQSREMGLQDVHFSGAVRQSTLNALYAVADVFLSMSEHEGFCIPIIESMHHDVPVLAFEAAAVPETMDGAGVLFREKRHDIVAEMMGKLAGDTALRSAVLRGQRERLNRYRTRNLPSELRAHLAPLLK
jgi:glycosyltransferase involved in cell wall biosynthesis